jgi:hypothetical protein
MIVILRERSYAVILRERSERGIYSPPSEAGHVITHSRSSRPKAGRMTA